jgi:putative acetyltransferase
MGTDLKFQIRRAVAADSLAIASLLHKAFVEYESLYTPGGFAATVLTPEQVETRMQEGPVWIVLRDDVVVATGAAVQKGDSLYIRGMAVAPEARGGAIGELLLREIERLAKETSAYRLFLSTTPFLTRAIKLYEKLGFQRTTEGPHDLFGTPLFTMEKIPG